MKELNIDLDYLVLAWEDESEENAYYLDIETGAVLIVRQDLLDRDDLTDEIEKNCERYLYIPRPSSMELREDLSDFVANIEDNHLRTLMEVAMESPNVLFACKKVLSQNQEELFGWEKFREGRVRMRVRQWLQVNFLAQDTDNK